MAPLFRRPSRARSTLCGVTGGLRHRLISVSPPGQNAKQIPARCAVRAFQRDGEWPTSLTCKAMSGLFRRDLSAADKGSGLIHDQARRFDITAHSATSPQLATFLGRDIAFNG